ncbi:hypothetical protein GINT2_000545 [Glugoides intestinalis]
MGIDSFYKEFNKKDEFYIPKDQSRNELRHFGEKTPDGFLLSHDEVLYLFDKEDMPKELKSKIYFDLKNRDYNLLRGKGRTRLYNKTKHFNRSKAKPISDFQYVCGEDEVDLSISCKTVFAVEGWGDYCLIEIESLEELSKKTEESLKKMI